MADHMLISMKLLITSILMMLITTASAEWVRGTVKLKDGQLLNGHIKNFRNESTTNIDFKRRLNEDVQEISSDNISEVQLKLSDGTLVAKYLHTAIINIAGEYKISNDKRWMRVIYRGEFDVVSYFSKISDLTDYYIAWPDEDKAVMIYINQKNGSIANSKETLLRKSISTIFENRCNAMITSVNNEVFVPNDIRDILMYYVDKCKKQEDIGIFGN